MAYMDPSEESPGLIAKYADSLQSELGLHCFL